MSLQLTPQEVTITQIALSGLVEDLTAVSTNPSYPFTPQARIEQKEMLDCAKSALAKIATVSGELVQLDPYKEGDEDEFLTKES